MAVRNRSESDVEDNNVNDVDHKKSDDLFGSDDDDNEDTHDVEDNNVKDVDHKKSDDLFGSDDDDNEDTHDQESDENNDENSDKENDDENISEKLNIHVSPASFINYMLIRLPSSWHIFYQLYIR